MQLTYDEIMNILDIKCFPSEKTRYTLPPGIFEISDINKSLEDLMPENVEVSITTDDIRLKSKLKTDQFSTITNKSFFYTLLGVTQSLSGPLCDTDRNIQLKPDKNISNRPTNFTAIDKVL